MKQCDNGCAGCIDHPFVENDGFCERMIYVASTIRAEKTIVLDGQVAEYWQREIVATKVDLAYYSNFYFSGRMDEHE